MLLSPAPDVNKLSATDGNIIPSLKIFKNFWTSLLHVLTRKPEKKQIIVRRNF
jgi:hypothetical protein